MLFFSKLRGLFFFLLIAFGCTSAQAPLPALLTGDGNFEHDSVGWHCQYLSSDIISPLLQQLQKGDILLTLDGKGIGQLSPVDLAQELRAVGWGIVERATVLRQGNVIELSNHEDGSALPRIVTAQSSSLVIYSTIPELHKGDELLQIAGKSWEEWERGFADSPGALRQLNLQGHPWFVARRGKEQFTVKESSAVTLQFVRLAMPEPEDSLLQRLAVQMPADSNGKRFTFAELRGHWVLVHFFASWCMPCHREMPEIVKIGSDPRLILLPSGYADSVAALSSSAQSEELPRWFPPSGEMIDLLGVDGIPYDVLFSPEGEPVLVISGAMAPGGTVRKINSYLNR